MTTPYQPEPTFASLFRAFTGQGDSTGPVLT